MRCLAWVFIVGFLLLIHQTAIADTGCSSCNGNDSGSYRTFRGPACFTPPGYCSSPGCCECPPSACDNAWDGYCEHKAKWQAYFAKVGTPREHCHGCPVMVPADSCSNCADIRSAAEQRSNIAAKSTIPLAQRPSALSPGKATLKPVVPRFR